MSSIDAFPGSWSTPHGKADKAKIVSAIMGGTVANGSEGYATPVKLPKGKAYFSANKNGPDQTAVADRAIVQVTATTEAFDIGGYLDAANSKWTPPAGPVRLPARVSRDGNCFRRRSGRELQERIGVQNRFLFRSDDQQFLHQVRRPGQQRRLL